MALAVTSSKASDQYHEESVVASTKFMNVISTSSLKENFTKTTIDLAKKKDQTAQQTLELWRKRLTQLVYFKGIDCARDMATEHI